MSGANFTEISARYERDSLIQKSAAEKLLGLLDIRGNENVLDLGCGTGGITRKLRTMTSGEVAGMDPSAGMIEQAERESRGLDILFERKSAEELDRREAFSVIFCNSAFQWFRQPSTALRNCCRALRKGGRMGIQAPAKKDYCPNFLKAIEAVSRDPRTAETFSGFAQPWTFFETAKEYQGLFAQAGLAAPFAVIEEIKTRHSPDEVMTIFESGAAAGYLNRQYYEVPVDEAYARTFREIARESFQKQADGNGRVELVFNRIYLIGVK